MDTQLGKHLRNVICFINIKLYFMVIILIVPADYVLNSCRVQEKRIYQPVIVLGPLCKKVRHHFTVSNTAGRYLHSAALGNRKHSLALCMRRWMTCRYSHWGRGPCCNMVCWKEWLYRKGQRPNFTSHHFLLCRFLGCSCRSLTS
jgi:hypothetical protein